MRLPRTTQKVDVTDYHAYYVKLDVTKSKMDVTKCQTSHGKCRWRLTSATAAAEYFSKMVCDKKLCSCARDMVGVNVVSERRWVAQWYVKDRV